MKAKKSENHKRIIGGRLKGVRIHNIASHRRALGVRVSMASAQLNARREGVLWLGALRDRINQPISEKLVKAFLRR